MLSDDLRDNVVAKIGAVDTVHVIPNFVDTEAIVPADRATPYRAELGLGDGPVVLYAGNVGFSRASRVYKRGQPWYNGGVLRLLGPPVCMI